MTAEFDALSAAFCADFEEILDKRFRLSPNEVFHNCMDVLKAHSVCKYEDSLAPTLFLCHWVNRGTLMLNPQRMHSNGKKIHLGGADLSQLVNSYCIELALSGEHRKLNLQKNCRLGQEGEGPHCINKFDREVFEPWLRTHSWLLQGRSDWYSDM